MRFSPTEISRRIVELLTLHKATFDHPNKSVHLRHLADDAIGVGSVLIQDEGVAKGPAATINAVGAGVTAAVAGGVATLTIPGGGGGAPDAHKDSHDPQDGSDPLDTAAPANIDGVQAAGVGTAHTFARADHAHRIQHSIADNALVTVDQADAADNDIAKFTANGLEGRSYAELLADLSGQAGANFAMNSKKITGLAAATAAGDAVRQEQNTRSITFAIADAATASTTVPKLGTWIAPIACIIAGIKIKLDNDETCGATSLIADIHKIPAANADTDGTGTTIYTTQGNRPTIANTHRYAAATAPDVTAVAAGDALVAYVDQAGTGVTMCSITVSFNP